MYRVKAIIGTGYGDEGKGMWTNQMVKNSNNPLVVRNNGGAQVGHTVVENGKRYIFSHLGSGSLYKAPTLYTRYSVVSPTLFLKEVNGRNKGLNSQIFIEGRTPVTTHYDIFLNQVTEIARGKDRHGSTGCGFGVTLERIDDGVTLFYEDLFKDTDLLVKKIKAIRDWCLDRLPNRMPFFLDSMDEAPYNIMYRSLDKFIEECKAFCSKTEMWKNSFNFYDDIIFENGQGLLLDQEYGEFPNVTRSNTGFRNIGKILKRLGNFGSVPVDVYYISRCYTTRHGAGPLDYEKEGLSGINVEDPTNIHNDFQGSLRFAPLNICKMNKAIFWDRQTLPTNANIYKVVTCCDQVDPLDTISLIDRNDRLRKEINYDEFLDILSYEFNILNWSPEGLIYS